MSSILEALKKVEQESTLARGADTPWPAPPSMRPPLRRRNRRWWVPLSILGGVCVAGVALWQVWPPDATRPADSMSALPSAEPDHRAPLPVTEVPPSNLPVAGTAPTPPDKTRMKTISGQAAADAPASAVPLAEPIAAAPSVRPGTQPLPSATPAPEPVIAHGEDPASRPAETAAVSQPAAAPLDAGKILKHDPRIDLQALVWAPESAARFVVINNRLIKEGGSVDNIVVVRINPDDVLLAEGSDQWHEPFTIR